MLFSEPKIPHRSVRPSSARKRRSFSALQRAENSSLDRTLQRLSRVNYVSVLFSEPKIPHRFPKRSPDACGRVSVLFSEPKIPHAPILWNSAPMNDMFQCSSASRKFLTRAVVPLSEGERICFSALQRAENSSRRPDNHNVGVLVVVSVLFSEPKIPHSLSFLTS